MLVKGLKLGRWGFILSCLLFSIQILSSNLVCVCLSKDTNLIELQGRLAESELRLSTQEVLVFKNLTTIVISPMVNIENIIIKVTDNLGNIIYTNNMHLNMDTSISIETIDWKEGEYTLIILHKDGGMLSGSFSIQD